MTRPTVSDQVKALAAGLGYSLAFSHFHTDRPSVQQIASMFSLQPDDIHHVVAHDDFWLRHVQRSPGPSDGFYLLANDPGYTTYEQERGAQFEKQRWDTFEQARAAYAAKLVRDLEVLRRNAAAGR